MNRFREKTTATLLIAIFVISIFAVAMPIIAQTAPTIDGVISSGEYDGASSYSLGSYMAYMMNDDQFMYVAFDYPITTGSDFASFNTYKEGTFIPETINAPCVSSWGPVWDKIVDSDDDGVPDAWSREDPSTRYECDVDTAWEMKVPLAELGLEAGDVIKTMLVLNAHMIGTYIYPEGADSYDLNTYADVTLWAPPPPQLYWFKASGGGVSTSDVSPTAGNFITLGVMGISLAPASYEEELVPCKGSGTLVDHTLKMKLSFDIAEGRIKRSGRMLWFYGYAKIFDIQEHVKYYDIPFRLALVDDQHDVTNRFDVETYGDFPMHWHGTLEPGSEVTVWVWE